MTARHNLDPRTTLFLALTILYLFFAMSGCITLNIGTSQTKDNPFDMSEAKDNLSESDSLWLAHAREELNAVRGLEGTVRW